VVEDFSYPKEVMVLNVERYDAQWIPDKLSDAVTWLSNILESIPEEYRGAAKIDVDGFDSYDVSTARISVTYARPPTAEEIAARKARAQADAERDLAWARNRVAEEERRLSAAKS
jgi:hypothetical protein